MAQRIVDFLEPVEVEPQDRQLIAFRDRDKAFDQMVIEAPRGSTGL
jgi:hypothetical protein